MSLFNPSLPGESRPSPPRIPGLRERWSFGRCFLRAWKKSKYLEISFKGRHWVSGFVCWNWAPQDLRLEYTNSAVQVVSRELITVGKGQPGESLASQAHGQLCDGASLPEASPPLDPICSCLPQALLTPCSRQAGGISAGEKAPIP